MKTEIRTITPQWADDVLKNKNPRNRKLNERTVAAIVRDIENNAFALTHQGIAFDDEGNLIDGQHRLTAVVKANKQVIMLVCTGIPVEQNNNGASIKTFALIDCGLPRSTAAVLQMEGHKNPSRLAASMRMILLSCAGIAPNMKLSSPQIHEGISLIGESADEMLAMYDSGKLFVPTSPSFAALIIYHTAFPQNAKDFLLEASAISGGEMSPSRALVTWCKNHPSTGCAAQQATFSATASALMAFHQCREVSRVTSGDAGVAWLLGLNPALTKKLARIVKR